MRTIIKGGTVVTAGDTIDTSVLIEDGVVKALGYVGSNADSVIDASGLLVMPGGIDPHTHLSLPAGGTFSSDDFFTGHKAAAFGGTTCQIDFAMQVKGGTLAEGLKTWHEKANGKAVIDYAFHMGIVDPTEEALAEIETMPAEGISSLKIFLAYKNVLQLEEEAVLKILKIAGRKGMLTLVHAENGEAIYQTTQELLAQGKNTMRYHSEAHSAIAESEATSRAVDYVEMTGAPLYVVHTTAGQGLQAIRRGRRRGLPIMAETCSQYLVLTDKYLATDSFEGAKYICSPPPKSEWDQSIIYECLADGTIQTVATDHCPFWFEGGKDGRLPGKELGKDCWAKVPNGVPGIEDRLVVLWHKAVNSGLITPEQFVALSSTNAAKIFGMYPRKGTIAPGSDADIVLFNPNKKRVISAKTHHMNVDYNVYEGMEVTGWPEKVFSRGRLLVDGDKWLGEAGTGKYIPRETHAAIL